MERLQQLIEYLPKLVNHGLIDVGGGNVAVRTEQGIFVSPSGASTDLHWQLTEDDFVLFPGEGDASMAKAGRRPSRSNWIHRAVLNAVPAWNFSLHGHLWGLTGFAYAKVPLELSEFHSGLLSKHTGVKVPVITVDKDNRQHTEAAIAKSFSKQAKGSNSAAALIVDDGPLFACKELKHLLSLGVMLENAARAQQWKLLNK